MRGGAGTSATQGAAAPSMLELAIDKYTTDQDAVPQAYQRTEELVATLDSSLGALGGGGGAGAQKVAATAGAGQAQGQAQRRELEEQWIAEEEWGRREGGAGPWHDPLQEGPVHGGRGGGGGPLPPGILPSGVGFEDVVPPGVRPPGFVPGYGGAPGLMEGPPSRSGGMLVGPGHPMFGRGKLGEGPGPSGGGELGPLPAGARWDPIGPPGTRGFRPDNLQGRDPAHPHPDLAQPGPGKGTDWDVFYG